MAVLNTLCQERRIGLLSTLILGVTESAVAAPTSKPIRIPVLWGCLDLMMGKKVNTVRRLLREEGLPAVVSYGWLRLRGRQSSVRLDNSRFGLNGIHGQSKMAMLKNGYELQERLAITRYLRRDLPVVELGGSIGVVACLTNRLLKDRKAHVVVEANPFAIPHLERNKQRNRCEFEIVNRAIAYRTDTVTFRPSSKMCGNSITSEGDQPPVTVPTVNWASWYASMDLSASRSCATSRA